MNNFDLGSDFSWQPKARPDLLPAPTEESTTHVSIPVIDDIIDETRRKVAECKRRNAESIPDIRKLPIPITRDFSDFPFIQLELNADDKECVSRSRCFKFQTSYYIAYVHYTLQNYIKAEHLENPNDSIGMREARRNQWGYLSGRESYAIRERYPYECGVTDYEHSLMDNQHFRENRGLYGDEIVDGIDKIERKNKWDRTWHRCEDFFQENTKKIGFVATAAIGATVFFCFLPVRPLFSW